MYVCNFYHSLHIYYIFSLYILISEVVHHTLSPLHSPLSNLSLHNSSAVTDSVPSFHLLKKHLIKTAPLCLIRSHKGQASGLISPELALVRCPSQGRQLQF